MERTKRRARQTVFWPNLNKDICKTVSACQQCREYLPSQATEPLRHEPRPTLPFEHASADLFSCQGWEILAFLIDCPVGPVLHGWAIVHLLEMSSVGFANGLRMLEFRLLITDGGPQFSSGRFAQLCQRWNVEHRKSTPHYPQSNGHTESAVKAVKYLILKTTKNGDLDTDAFQRGLLEWRNNPRESGHSPAQILFGHPLQSFMFAHRSSFSTE